MDSTQQQDQAQTKTTGTEDPNIKEQSAPNPGNALRSTFKEFMENASKPEDVTKRALLRQFGHDGARELEKQAATVDRSTSALTQITGFFERVGLTDILPEGFTQADAPGVGAAYMLGAAVGWAACDRDRLNQRAESDDPDAFLSPRAFSQMIREGVGAAAGWLVSRPESENLTLGDHIAMTQAFEEATGAMQRAGTVVMLASLMKLEVHDGASEKFRDELSKIMLEKCGPESVSMAMDLYAGIGGSERSIPFEKVVGRIQGAAERRLATSDATS